MLERGGADLGKAAARGATPLDVAIEQGHDGVARWLQSEGVVRGPADAAGSGEWSTWS